MKSYILSIDQGTTSSRAIIFDQDAQLISRQQQEFEQIFPSDGWVEHRPQDILDSTLATCRAVLKSANLSAANISAIGITNQRETTIVWDKETGESIYNAIVWQDRRTHQYCSTLAEQGHGEMITEKTGLLLDAYFSASKINWILDNVEGARARAEAGELLFGTVDCFLLWHLTAGASHATDATNASRTMLFNIHSQEWDKELLTLFNIPPAMLPEVKDCAADFGTTAREIFGESIPIAGIAGDQQAALFGQACFGIGMAKSTYGTGCFLIINTGDQAIKSKHRLLTTVGYRLNGEVSYALEGSIFIAGAAIQWLRDGLKIITDAGEVEDLARQANSDSQVVMVPAFTGLGAPHWDPNARGAIFGLTRDTGIADIVAAALKAVCYQTQDLISAIEEDNIKLDTLCVDGGMANNNWMLQFLSDLTAVKVQRPKLVETTALGAAYLAGLQVGIFQSLDDISQRWQCQAEFSPNWSDEQRLKHQQLWHQSVAKVLT
ncbi:MAG: glycerol kinase GlpK [Oceanospirillaceae bacterium]|nr:glycerol kinase GlpK [Oceanospirillaceae bacterium]